MPLAFIRFSTTRTRPTRLGSKIDQKKKRARSAIRAKELLRNEAYQTCHILSCAAYILNAQEHVNRRVGRKERGD